MVIALDINRFANMATLTTAQRNRTADNIDAVTMDMFSALSSGRCKAMVDLILFNPVCLSRYMLCSSCNAIPTPPS